MSRSGDTRTPPRPHREVDPSEVTGLVGAAQKVLRANWLGASTIPSRQLYPHQWSWDSAFISIGRSWFDEARARQELMGLFAAQWANGKLPHIVFDPSVAAADYFPGPDFWASEISADAPTGVRTSGLTQPPIHARAALEMHRHTKNAGESLAFLRTAYPALVAQHNYLDTLRDPDGSGLPSIFHPWESGLDNSPVWDRDLASLRIPPGTLPAYRRHDITRAAPEDRPSDATYDAFVYLVLRYREAGYDDAAFLESAPFRIAGPLFTAIHLWSTHALVEIAELIGADPAPHREQAERIHGALIERLWDGQARRFYPLDLRNSELEPQETIVSFGPLLDPDLPAEMVRSICDDLESSCFHPDADDHFVVPSSSVRARDFEPGRYWRGPVWINTNWLLLHGLEQHGQHDLAAEILASSLALVVRSGFREYFEPFGGAGHGADNFSWTAALALDMAVRAGSATI
jgi:hypothetical protein